MTSLRKKFLDEVGIDLSDHEYVGKFPYYRKDGKESTVTRGEGFKKYAEWLENKHKLKQ